MKRKETKVDSGHPLLGTWVEDGDPDDITDVVFTITARKRRLIVSGVDTSDGEQLVVSNTRFNGRKLTFDSLYRPNNHSARNVFRLIGKRSTKVTVRFSFEEEEFRIKQIWKKVS